MFPAVHLHGHQHGLAGSRGVYAGYLSGLPASTLALVHLISISRQCGQRKMSVFHIIHLPDALIICYLF